MTQFLLSKLNAWLSFLLLVLPSALAGAKRTVIITGANRGIGLATVKQLAATNQWQIIMACRSQAEAAKALTGIPSEHRGNVEIQNLDLADFESIQQFAKNWKKSNRPLDVLACNAGIQLTGSKEVQLTVQGFERTVGVNHIGHFLLVKEMLAQLKSTTSAPITSNANPRIVIVGSGVHNPDEKGGNVGSKATLGSMKGLERGFVGDLNVMVDGGEYDADKCYKDSKLCNVVFALELARRLKSQRSKVTCNVMNPGLIPTTGTSHSILP